LNGKSLPPFNLPDGLPDMMLHGLAQAPFAVLLFGTDEDLTTLWRNSAHEAMTDTVGEDFTGRALFEAFPPSASAEGAEAMHQIKAAVAQLTETRETIETGPHRYDLRGPDGTFREHHWRMQMSPVIQDGKVTAVFQTAHDATRDVLDAELLKTLQRSAESSASISYFRFDPETDRFIRSLGVDEMFGFKPGEAGPFAAPFFDRVHSDDLPSVYAEVERVFASPRGEIAAFDYRVPHEDGTERFLRIRAEVAIDPEDRREKLVGTFTDLTDVEHDRQSLRREVAMREALVEEANHRIKNSLAIALSMLRMERRALGQYENEATAALGALEARINAISAAHGLMRLEHDRIDVSLHAFVREILGHVVASLGTFDGDMDLDVSGPDLSFESQKATSLGLILNELLTNALKYGLNREGHASVGIQLDSTSDEVVIEVRNKIEKDAPIDVISSSNFGMRLIHQLADDMDMTFTAEAEGDDFVAQVKWTN
jgi:two-component sensor histidine kinase